jgi:hypothetical protein
VDLFGISRSLTINAGLLVGLFGLNDLCGPTQVELKDPWDHDDRLRAVAILEKGESQRFGTINKQSAA